MKAGISEEDSISCAHFIKNQQNLIDKFLQESSEIYEISGTQFKEEYERYCQLYHNTSGDDYKPRMQSLETLYKMFSILKQKVFIIIYNNQIRHKSNVIYAKMKVIYLKNLYRRAFQQWKERTKFIKYLQEMNFYCHKRYIRGLLGKAIKTWKLNTMDEVKLGIKYKQVKKTENEITKTQRDYEKIIKNLEEILEKKMIELKQEEEQHKILYNRYDQMIEKKNDGNLNEAFYESK